MYGYTLGNTKAAQRAMLAKVPQMLGTSKSQGQTCCKADICHSLRNGCSRGSKLSAPLSAPSPRPHPSSLHHKNQPQCRPLMSHRACALSPRLDNWLERNDHLGTGLGHVYLISCVPCHARGCTYTTEVNRKSTKEQKCSWEKDCLWSPPFSSSKRRSLRDLSDLSDLSSLTSYF
jgi:hypothetical protein